MTVRSPHTRRVIAHQRSLGSATSQSALSWLNFLIALMQTAFGAFLAVHLAAHGWSRTAVGVALAVGSAASMVAQVPGGMAVDAAPSKRVAAAVAVGGVMAGAVLIALAPSPGPVYFAQVLQGAGGAILAPAVAAITLALSRQTRLGERLGSNMRFAAIGSALAAGLMGGVGAVLSHAAMFWMAAACAPLALVAIFSIRTSDLRWARHRGTHKGGWHPRQRKGRQDSLRQVATDVRLWRFAVCMALFTLGNAALLPTAAGALARAEAELAPFLLSDLWSALPPVPVRGAELIVAAWVLLPQLLAAAAAPWMGRLAQVQGRRAVLLLGFLALPLRALVFAYDGHDGIAMVAQTLDGVSAAAVGVMVPLVVADITSGHGRFNFAMGVVGLVVGLAGAASTVLAGMIGDSWGETATFLALGVAGVAAVAMVLVGLPETRPRPVAHPFRLRVGTATRSQAAD